MRVTETKATQASLVARLRQQPNDTDARLQLFRFAVIDGNWTRASSQLDVAIQLDASLAHTVMVYRANIACELLRQAVFSGAKPPSFSGTPPSWTRYLLEALNARDREAGALLVNKAFEQAAPAPGTINGKPFEWLADGDSRLGPVLETFIDGAYYWLPFENIERIDIPVPEDLLDLAWCSCDLRFVDGGACNAYIPARYPGIDASCADDIKLARATQWNDWTDALQTGMGQRMFVSDEEEYALLDCREIVFSDRGQS